MKQKNEEMLGAEWRSTKLGELLSFSNGKASPKRANDLPYPVFGSNGIIGFTNEANAHANTIVIGRVGSYCGSLFFSKQKCWITDNAIRANALNDNDAKFLFYLLKSLNLNNWRTGSGQPLINQSILSNIDVSVPKPKEQRAIARIFGTLDDKIELNRRMNETLEAMARALFKSWFVDFDPVLVNALKAGNPISEKFARRAAHYRENPGALGLPEHILRLFPDRFVESELGPIPEGWEVKKLGEIADVNWGDTNVTKKSYTASGFLAYSAKGPDGYLPYYDYSRTGIVLSAIGANAGRTWLAQGKWSCIKNTIRFWAIDSDTSTEFLYYATLGQHYWPRRGSAQPFISQGDAKKKKVLKPGRSLGKIFGEITQLHHRYIFENTISSRTLAALRDTLLPKLISGELRIKDVERFIERESL